MPFSAIISRCFIVLGVAAFASGLAESCKETCTSNQNFEDCVGKLANHNDADGRKWCCQVTWITAGHYFTGCSANGIVWNTTCPPGLYQSSRTLSVENRSCMQCFECIYPETVTAAAGNNVNNTVCECNGNLGYIARNALKRSGLLNPIDCVLSPSTTPSTLSPDKQDSHSSSDDLLATRSRNNSSENQHYNPRTTTGLLIFTLIAFLLIVGAVFAIRCLPYCVHSGTSLDRQQSYPTSAEVVDMLREGGSAME